MCELKGNATTVVKKKKAYMKPVTSKVELPKPIADCSYDDVIKSSTGDTTIGWKSDESILFLVIKSSESDEPGSHYYFNPDPNCTYRFTNGTGKWAQCNWNYGKGANKIENPCEYNVVGSCSVQKSCDGGETWDDVSLTSWSGGH